MALEEDPLAPGTGFAGPQESGSQGKEPWEVGSAGKDNVELPDASTYPDEWEAIKQDEERKRKKAEDQEKDARRKEEEERRKKVKAEKVKQKAEADRKKAEAADKSKDRDSRPGPTKETSKDESLKKSDKVFVTVDDKASGTHTHEDGTDSRHGHNITTTLVVGRLNEDPFAVSWIHEEIRDLTHKRIYIVDDPGAPLHLNQNKGREAMVYLRYILDFYDSLDDVTLFYHASRSAWHNSALFNRDAAIMINQLNRSHVQDVGYMNARCELYPGCPSSSDPTKSSSEKGWIMFNPTKAQSDVHWERNADLFNRKLWDKLFPDRKRDPAYLSEPCCSQFAATRETIRSVPHSTYQRIHDWLGTTDEFDGYTGRIMEYVWQYLFLNKDQHCPNMRDCYCKGYDLCLSDAGYKALREYNAARAEIDEVLGKLGEDNVMRGCDRMPDETEKQRKVKENCESKNKWLKPLTTARGRKGKLEEELPKKYGILKPGGKIGDGVGKVNDVG